MKRWIFILIGLVVVGLVLAGFFFRKTGNGQTQFRFAKVTRGELVRQVNATGGLQAVTTDSVGSQVSGTIYAIYADFNDHVRKGQHLALLDTTFLYTQVTESQANLDKAVAANNVAKRAFFRAESLATQKLISSADYDGATNDYETAQANVEAAKAQLLRAKTNLSYAHIDSPIDGIVVSRNINVGQTVAASLSSPTLFTIAQDLAEMQLLAAVDEADVGQIAVDNPVTFTVDAFPEMVFHGDVVQVRIAPTIQSNVVTYTVVIGVDNKTGKLLPGMTATVTIETARKDDALKIASAATRFRPTTERAAAPASGQGAQVKKTVPHDGGDRASMALVYVLSPTKDLIKKRVKTGLSTTSEIEIVEGLSEGDSVVTGMTGASSAQSSSSSSQQTTNPFQPPRMGGPGGGGAGGRGGR